MRKEYIEICDHVAGLDRVPLFKRTELPNSSGIYFVLWGDVIVYVGLAKNIRRRWYRHHRENDFNNLKGDVWIAYEKVRESKLEDMEQYFIVELNPPLNANRQIRDESGSHYGRYFKSMVDHLAVYMPRADVFKEHKIPINYFYKVINLNARTPSGNQIYSPIEWLVKLTRNSKNYCMAKKVAKDIGCVLLTPDEISDIKNILMESAPDPVKVLGILQKLTAESK